MRLDKTAKSAIGGAAGAAGLGIAKRIKARKDSEDMGMQPVSGGFKTLTPAERDWSVKGAGMIQRGPADSTSIPNPDIPTPGQGNRAMAISKAKDKIKKIGGAIGAAMARRFK